MTIVICIYSCLFTLYRWNFFVCTKLSNYSTRNYLQYRIANNVDLILVCKRAWISLGYVNFLMFCYPVIFLPIYFYLILNHRWHLFGSIVLLDYQNLYMPMLINLKRVHTSKYNKLGYDNFLMYLFLSFHALLMEISLFVQYYQIILLEIIYSTE